MKDQLANGNCRLEYRVDEKEIFGRDLLDSFNEPAFFTKNKRGIAKAWEKLVAEFNETTTLHDAIRLLSASNIKTHYWCMVD